MGLYYGSKLFVYTKNPNSIARNILLRGDALGLQYVDVFNDYETLTPTEAYTYIFSENFIEEFMHPSISFLYQDAMTWLFFKQIENNNLQIEIMENSIEWRKDYHGHKMPELSRYSTLLMDLCIDFIPNKISIESDFGGLSTKKNTLKIAIGFTATYNNKSLTMAEQLLKNTLDYGYELYLDKTSKKILNLLEIEDIINKSFNQEETFYLRFNDTLNKLYLYQGELTIEPIENIRIIGNKLSTQVDVNFYMRLSFNLTRDFQIFKAITNF